MELPGTNASPNTVIAEMLRMQRRFIVFLPLTTQKEPPAATKAAASFVDLNSDEDRKSWSLNCALADGTNAAVEKYRAPRHSLVAALQETTPIAPCQEGLESGFATADLHHHQGRDLSVAVW